MACIAVSKSDPNLQMLAYLIKPTAKVLVGTLVKTHQLPSTGWPGCPTATTENLSRSDQRSGHEVAESEDFQADIAHADILYVTGRTMNAFPVRTLPPGTLTGTQQAGISPIQPNRNAVAETLCCTFAFLAQY